MSFPFPAAPPPPPDPLPPGGLRVANPSGMLLLRCACDICTILDSGEWVLLVLGRVMDDGSRRTAAGVPISSSRELAPEPEALVGEVGDISRASGEGRSERRRCSAVCEVLANGLSGSSDSPRLPGGGA